MASHPGIFGRRKAVRLSALLAAVGALMMAGCGEGTGSETGAMKLAIPALASGKDIPARFTCDGEDRSPALEWSDPPAGTRSFALILDDPDAPGGVFRHWGAYDIEPATRQLAEGAGNAADAPFRQARNDFGAQGYRGPCPPRGHGPHRYRFTLYALDAASLGAGNAPSVADVEQAVTGHVLDVARATAPYGRN